MRKGTNPASSNNPPIGMMASLQILSAQMSEAGYSAEHPWRRQLAGIISGQDNVPAAGSILDGVDKIDLAVGILDDLLRLALDKCAAVGDLGEGQSAIRAARRYACDIREQTAVIATGAFA